MKEPQIRKPNNENCLHSMERSYQKLLILKGKLSSYVYEPRTYDSFEQAQELRYDLERLSLSHLEIMNLVKDKKQYISEVLKKSMDLLLEAKKLENGIESYIYTVRN